MTDLPVACTLSEPELAARRAGLIVLAAAFLFNLGQGVLRPALPLYLQRVFAANYRMVTLIPVVFGAGKWVASLPTGYLLSRLGRRPLMVTGLLLVAGSDIASATAVVYRRFLGLRALAGVGWAMFGTVATTTMVDHRGAGRRGRAVSLLLMSETLGLLVGTAAGGWLYQRVGLTSPFVFEAACMLVAALVVASQPDPPVKRPVAARLGAANWRLLSSVLRVPGVLLMSLTNAALMAIQAGVLVFLFPLYLAEQGRLSPETIGYLVSLGVLGRLSALWLGGSASDRWGRPPVLVPGLLGYGVLLVSLTLISHPMLLGLWSFMIGAGGGFVASLPTAIIGDRVAAPLQGIAIGWLRTVTDSGMLVGPLAMGALADAVHLATAFIVAGAVLGGLAWGCHRHASRLTA
jgi:MFS family permease